MDPILYRSAGEAKTGMFPLKYNDQLDQQLTGDKSNFLHVCAQFHDYAEFVGGILDMQSSNVNRTMLTWQNCMGETALHVASRNARFNILKFIIQKMETLDDGEEDLENGVKITNQTIRAADKHGDTPLHNAVRNNHKQVVEFLLRKDPHFEHSMNQNGEAPLYLAISRKHFDITDSILTICTSPCYKGPRGKTALHAAILSYNSDFVDKILKRFPSLATEADDSGWIPLHYATTSYLYLFALDKLLAAEGGKSTAYITTSKDDDNKTALHLSACSNQHETMSHILKVCPDSWNMGTSKAQNVLHLAVESECTSAVTFILKQDWAINLINEKDAQGNTPLHLYLKIDFDKYSLRSPLLSNPKVDWEAMNHQSVTPIDLMFTPRTGHHPNLCPFDILFDPQYFFYEDLSTSMRSLGYKLEYEYLRRTKTYGDYETLSEARKKRWTQGKQRRLQQLRKNAKTHLLVSTLIATVTFAAGFTLPGGYDDHTGANHGMAVLIEKTAFKTFIVTDTIAVISSIVAIFLHFTATSVVDDEKLYRRYISALLLIVMAMTSMVIAFVSGLYVVSRDSSGLAITLCVLGSFAILIFGCMLNRDAHFLFDKQQKVLEEERRRTTDNRLSHLLELFRAGNN